MSPFLLVSANTFTFQSYYYDLPEHMHIIPCNFTVTKSFDYEYTKSIVGVIYCNMECQRDIF